MVDGQIPDLVGSPDGFNVAVVGLDDVGGGIFAVARPSIFDEVVGAWVRNFGPSPPGFAVAGRGLDGLDVAGLVVEPWYGGKVGSFDGKCDGFDIGLLVRFSLGS